MAMTPARRRKAVRAVASGSGTGPSDGGPTVKQPGGSSRTRAANRPAEDAGQTNTIVRRGTQGSAGQRVKVGGESYVFDKQMGEDARFRRDRAAGGKKTKR